MEHSRIPNRLRKYRRIAGYSQKKAARLLGFQDTSTLSRWERGITMPSMLRVLALARMYFVQPEDLYDELWQRIPDVYDLSDEQSSGTQ